MKIPTIEASSPDDGDPIILLSYKTTLSRISFLKLFSKHLSSSAVLLRGLSDVSCFYGTGD